MTAETFNLPKTETETVTGNGNVSTDIKPTTGAINEQSLLLSIILTIYDVIVFLGTSIGYICQVSIIYLEYQLFLK